MITDEYNQLIWVVIIAGVMASVVSALIAKSIL